MRSKQFRSSVFQRVFVVVWSQNRPQKWEVITENHQNCPPIVRDKTHPIATKGCITLWLFPLVNRQISSPEDDYSLITYQMSVINGQINKRDDDEQLPTIRVSLRVDTNAWMTNIPLQMTHMNTMTEECQTFGIQSAWIRVDTRGWHTYHCKWLAWTQYQNDAKHLEIVRHQWCKYAVA